MIPVSTDRRTHGGSALTEQDWELPQLSGSQFSFRVGTSVLEEFARSPLESTTDQRDPHRDEVVGYHVQSTRNILFVPIGPT